MDVQNNLENLENYVYAKYADKSTYNSRRIEKRYNM